MKVSGHLPNPGALYRSRRQFPWHSLRCPRALKSGLASADEQGWIMISLRKTATELDRLEELRQTLAKCYGLAIKSSAEYAVEIDPHSTEYFRQRLQLLDTQCAQSSAPEQYN